IHLVDQEMRLVPVGVPGELLIGGVGLARGYLGRPDLTAGSFVPDPFSGQPGRRLYRTGDLARHLLGGEIEYLGRIDQQVKLRGVRIELGEIEAVLAAHPGVREVVVQMREDRPGDPRLVAYAVPAAENPPAADELRHLAGARLPAALVPSTIAFLEALPHTATGKIDRKALPAPQAVGTADAGYTASLDPIEELLAGIWAEVLGLDRFGAHDNFFALGGHSLLATQVVSRIRGVLAVELPLRRLFESPTVAELACAVREAREEGAPIAPPIVPVPRHDDLPLSFAQQRLWFLDQLAPESPLYNLPAPLRIAGPLDVAVLARSLTEIVRRHEVLRTVFASVDGELVQRVQPSGSFGLPVIDLSALPEAEREALALALAGTEASRPFDLVRGPLFRSALLRMGPEDHVALVTMHHIVSDGWSMDLMVRELTTLYPAFLAGDRSPLPPLPVQYADFALWQRSWLQGEVLESQVDYWKRQLDGAPAVLELPLDRPRPAEPSYRGAVRSMALPFSLAEEIRGLCRQQRVTPFMALLAAWAVLLGRHAAQDDLLLGTPIAGRNRREIETLIGFFVNTLVLRSDLSGNPTFSELLARVRRTALDAFTHQDLPFERVVEEVVVERNLAVSPLFQVLFTLQNAPREELKVPGLMLSQLDVDTGVSKFDLSLVLEESPPGFVGWLEHNADLFDGTTAERMLENFRELLAHAADDPGQRLQELALLASAERHQVLIEWSRPLSRPAEPEGRLVQDLFWARAARAPGAIALVADGSPMSYGQLAARADRLARHLIRQGAGPEVAVGICLDAPAEIVTALLAVLRAGSAFLPLDPSYPAERLGFILADARAAVVVTRNELLDRVGGGSARVFPLDGRLEDPEETAPAASGAFEPIPCRTENLAYVIYTSGTTGQPKGVAITHKTLVPMLAWGIERFGLGDSTRVLLNLAPWFDFGVFEILTTLLAGGTLHISDERKDASRQSAYLREHRINTLHSTPSFFHEVLASGELLPDLEILHLGGEALHQASVQRIFDVVGDRCRLYNGYGPTEATINCALFDVGTQSERRDRGAAAIPIGRATARHALYVLDRQGEPSGIGLPGELWVGGEGLARGYLHRPELTAERFLPDPFSLTPGARLYRTGDLVRALATGDLEFLGRIDQQVKLRGVRIELGEIEAVLAAHPGVREVVVRMREDRPGDPRLVAYAVPAAENPPTVEELRRRAGARLPTALVPSAIVFLEALPRTATGKVDRKALPAPDRAHTLEPLGPRNLLELEIARIWEEVLGTGPVGVREDFFELGGHSLLAVRMTSLLESRLGRRLPLAALLRHPTVESLAALLREGSSPDRSPLIEFPAGEGKPFFLIHPV
ncbi:MAG TPA: amino acid adenylation domain-containing protein, partial [Thermoanaerobaculia bacterium]|nr:amino acid adenylation domain-containing protein [Thermoanaerobaculia bacterium]